MRSMIPWATAVVIVILDRITKAAVVDKLVPGSWVEVAPGLALTHVHNPGIAFSLFSGGGPLTRVVLHLVIFTSVVIIAAMVVRHAHHSRLAGLAFGLILGGAVGNLVDRVRLGYVVDFIDVHFRGWHYPAFNVADSAITCGVALLIIDVFLISMRREEEQ